METEQYVTERTWTGAFLALVGALILGSLALPRLVYDRFIWRYFWGPIYSDANGAICAIKRGSEVTLRYSSCPGAVGEGVIAETGYTSVSTAGYMVVLLFMLVGVYLLLERLDVGGDKRLFFSLVPFMLFGGAVRVVEDVTDAAVDAGVEPIISYPLNVLFISPVIYVTVFVLTLGALLVSLKLEADGVVSNRYRSMGAIGLGILGLTLAYLFAVALTTEYAGFYPQILLVDVGLASILAYVIYVAADRYDSEINAGTGLIGLVVLWAHAIDGVANVVAADWLPELGHPLSSYGAKHVANRAIIEITESLQPDSLSAVIGTSWPFLVVKLVVALGIVWLFDEQIMDESPRYSLLLLVAAVAVGLGPGTRDILRVTFAI